MQIYHRIEVVAVTLLDLATSSDRRNELKKSLDEHGENGWATVQIQEVGGSLVILMTKEETN